MFNKLFEVGLNLIILIWLLMIAFLTHPYNIHKEGLPFETNDQYGNSHLLVIAISLIFSTIIILRLIKKNAVLRIVSLLIILITIVLTVYYWHDYSGFSEMIRNIIYGPLLEG